MNKRTALIFYVLSAYVVVQFIWWGYHLIELTEAINEESSLIGKRVTMIMGEGAVFLLLLLIGIWQIRRSIKKELYLTKRQKNFLLSVTHELKTPLAANKLYIQTVAKRDLDTEQRIELLNKAIDENIRLERMIDNILNATRLENDALNPVKEEFDITVLLKSIADRFKVLNSHNQISVEADQNLIISADRFMMETLLSNLTENAIKYAGKDAHIILYASENGGKVQLGVKDTGPGVSKELRQEIFKKFFRAENEETRSQKGTGLGLYIVDQLVKMQGGTIECKPNTPVGANFQITI